MPASETFADGALLLEVRDDIARATLNQPAKRNAMSRRMWEEFPALLARIEGDATVRVVIIQGAGGAFSAGADISEFETVYADMASTAHYNQAVRMAQKGLRDLPRPVIAEIQGACVGGGCGLALACDLRFAAADARFGITPAKLGLAYSLSDTLQLVEKVGAAAAKDILFSGRLFGAAEAHAMGLVDRVCEAASLSAETLAYAEFLAANSSASITIAKAMINSAMDELAARLSPRFGPLAEAVLAGPDFREGRAAFRDKRPPVFRPKSDDTEPAV